MTDKTKKGNEEKKTIRARIFNIMQYEHHSQTNQELLTEETIREALHNHKTIERYAYILHDKDVHTEEDVNEGEPIEPHWHIVIQCNTAVELAAIARWFKIAENFVEVPKGKGAHKFIDCVRYLTHEDEKQQLLGKYLYEDKEVVANFDFRLEIDKRQHIRERGTNELSDAENILYNVLYEGMTVDQVHQEYPLVYMKYLERIKKYRMDYILRQPPPQMRFNYYIYGQSGLGKDVLSRCIARVLIDPEHRMKDEEIFFVVGSGQVSFDGYDGQPVIIWSERRSETMLQVFGREQLFSIFDTHPAKARVNVKYGSINLCNVINIVNGQEDYTTFLNTLAGEYTDANGNTYVAEDKNQSYRRFPFIMPLRETDYSLLLNCGVFKNNRNLYQSYDEINVTGNFGKIADACGSDEKLIYNVSKPLLMPLAEIHNELENQMIRVVDENTVKQHFESLGYGEVIKRRSLELVNGQEIERNVYYEHPKLIEQREKEVEKKLLNPFEDVPF